jgi:tripartite-type tricarboxylate transporter receptor subunit TctC
MKNVGVALCAAVVLGGMAVAGCSKKNDGRGGAAGWTWDRAITVVCPGGVGGGADAAVRALQPALESIVGQSVTVVNVPGAGGAAGVNFAFEQDADVYTFVVVTPSVILLDLQKKLVGDFRAGFEPVVTLVTSTTVVVGSAAAGTGKYTDFGGLLDYIKGHPGAVICGTLTGIGQDAVALKQTLAGGLGVGVAEVDKNVTTVGYGTAGELLNALVAGHVGVSAVGAEDLGGLADNGGVTPLAVIGDKRSDLFPGTPCTGELGISVTSDSWRAVYAKVGTPKAAVNAFAAALKDAGDSGGYQDFKARAGDRARPGFADAAATAVLADSGYDLFTSYLKDIGILR